MMIGILAMSLILTAFVVLMVHNTKGTEPKALEIKDDSPFIGVWLVPGVSDKESMDYMEFDLKKDGTHYDLPITIGMSRPPPTARDP